jgi:hypothetical protein
MLHSVSYLTTQHNLCCDEVMCVCTHVCAHSIGHNRLTFYEETSIINDEW